MKGHGQITKIGPIEGAEGLLQVEITTSTKTYEGGRDHAIVIRTIISAERAAMKDFSLGDFFDITIERRPR